MSTFSSGLRPAAIIGLVCAAMEGILLVAADPNLGRWIFIQSVLAWFSCGFVIAISDTGLRSVAHSIFVALLFNLPWYIAIAIVPEQYRLIPPLVISTAIFGSVAGVLRSRLIPVS